MQTILDIDPEHEGFSDFVGEPYTFITYTGSVMVGVVELDARGVPIVRFPDGRWAYANYRYI